MIVPLHALARALLRAALPEDLRDAVAGDLDDEMHERIRAGATPRAAMAWALRQALGSIPHALGLRLGRRTTAGHHASGGRTMGVSQDVRYALRTMRTHPLVTCAAIGTLALGIGATTAIFSVVHAALLRELPFHEPDRIVSVYESFRSTLSRMVANPSNFDYWERHAASFSRMAGMRRMRVTLTGAGEASRVRLQAVTPAFFDVLGVSPAAGRRLTEADGTEPAPPVLLSDDLWTTRFGGDPAITSRTVTLDGTARPIAGVMPEGFRFPDETDLWQGLSLSADERADARSWYLGVVARLAPDVSIAEAQAELDVLARQLQAAHPVRQKDRGAFVVGLHEDLVFRVEEGLEILQGAVVLVLLIAVVNIASLLLARLSTRGREFGIRAALGASRARIVRQLLTESLLLGFAGAAGGIVLAVWGVRALVALSPFQLPPGMEPAIDGPVLAFALAVGVVTSMLFGVAPALVASRAGSSAREESSFIHGPNRRMGRLRSALVVAEVALAVILVVGAGLLFRSFTRLMSQDVGFAGERVVTADVGLPGWQYDTTGKRAQFWAALFERLQAAPGVAAAAGSTALPFSMWEWQTAFRVVGREAEPAKGTSIRTIHPRYFETLGIPILHGRGLTDRDDARGEPVVVVNETFARTYLAGVDPLGMRVRFIREPDVPPARIVGVTGDTRHSRLTEPPGPEMYRPLAQDPPQNLILAVKTSQDVDGAMSLLRSAVREIDRDVTVDRLTTLEALVAGTVADRRFYLTLMGFFSLVALALALIGVYSVMAYVVGQRTREFGIRMALGAAPRQIRRRVIGSGTTLVVAGLALGTGGALLASHVLESLLFGVAPRDPATIAVSSMLLGLLGLAAVWAPARRAGRLDPAAALRRD